MFLVNHIYILLIHLYDNDTVEVSILYDVVYWLNEIRVVWLSGWVRTLFFNPVRFDGQTSKPSPRVRTPELAQRSSSDKILCSIQSVGRYPVSDSIRRTKSTVQPTIWAFNSRILYVTKSSWAFDGQKFLFDSTRRTKSCVQFNPSNKNSNSFNPLEQKPQPVQPARAERVCPTLPNPRVGHPSSGLPQPDGYSRYEI
jgi:hypothetical protein